ncbi:MAG: helix-hairpin-helix domain-containing protein [Anaerovoracaceae bacterium]|jgi:competence protein ComEA
MEIKRPDLKSIDKKKLRWFVLIPVLLIAFGIYMAADGNGQESVNVERASSSAAEEQLSAEEEKAAGTKDDGYIYVDVSGAVNTPMVVCIPEGSRVFEALDAAGGKSAEASVKTLNLAAICEDGQKIYVPTEEEVKEGTAQAGQTGSGTDSTGSSGTGTGSSASSGSTAGSSSSTGVTSGSGTTSQGKVNINTAGSEELQTLTGVGPAIASRIIDYRNKNGAFKSIEDLTNVSGIGEKTLEKFKDEICV